MTDPGVDFSTTKDFSNETVLKTLARSQGITSTINISKMARGTVYFIYGSYVDTNRVTLTMSGPGQEDLIAEHEETMGANNVWISTFSFADAKDYNTISYHYFNADTDASRARFMGVIIDGSLDPLDPVPADGARVSASSTRDLSWTNLEPTTASDVVVDVYFGTDPNVPATFVKVVDGVNANTVQVDASTVGQTYYWQINSYRDGSTASDPNTGTIYSFTAVDIAPESVVINTPDMMTWWGEPVSLVPAPTVVDDGVSALSYLWTADAPAGIAVSFDEDTAATPDVTIVKEPYSAAVIVNAGFEADQQDEDGWGAKTGWGGTGGNWNPPADSYTGSAVPEGNMCAWTAGTISQVLAETLAPETQYELTVQVGNSMRYDWPEYNVQLLAGGIVLAEDPNLNVSVPRDSWALVTVSFDSTGVDPDLLGQPLEIRLSSLGNYPGDYAELNFDDVRLTADPPFAPTGVQSITLTLAVTDQSNPDIVTDSMMVDVYETACEVSQKGLGLNVKADYNQNCLVNPEDLTTMAVNWLDDTSATDFVVAEPGPAFAGQLGVLDITGINPATGEAWKVGDTYRLAFVSSGTRDAADPNITAYDAFVQAAADAVGLGGATWKCVGSNYGTGASTDYSAIRDANVGRMATEVPTYLLDGTTKLWDAFLSGNPLNTYSMTETGGTYLGNVATGGGRLFGDPTQEKIEHGNSGRVDGAWYRVYNGMQTSQWHFYAVSEPLTVVVPEVDAGDKISTWLGKTVTLAPTVKDPEATYDYHWEAETPPAWMNVTISDPNTETPTVTVTRVPVSTDIEIPDASFETRVINSTTGNFEWLFTSRSTDWRFADPDGTAISDDWGYSFLWHPAAGSGGRTGNWTAEGFNGIVPDGDNCVFAGSRTYYGADNPGGIAQLLDATYDPEGSYELSVQVGRTEWRMWGGYKLELLAGGTREGTRTQYTNKVVGGTVLGVISDTEVPEAEVWNKVTLTVDANPANADLAGEQLQIRITPLKIPDDPNITYVCVDDFKLVTDAPSALEPVKMTVTVNKQGETETASDSVMIDVYENACELVKVVDPSGIRATDINVDCVTNLTDFAALAADWLLDYEVKAAEPKPVVE